jgi:hypothetical protein
MTDALRRGLVIERDNVFGVVWRSDAVTTIILPIRRGRRHLHAADIPLEFEAMIACGVDQIGFVIRAGHPQEVRTEGQREIGDVPGSLMCRVVRAMIRSHQEASTVERWTGDREFRNAVASMRPVNLVSP